MTKWIFVCLIGALLLTGCDNRIKILKRAKKYYQKDDFVAAIEQYERLIDSYEGGDTKTLGLAEAHYFIGEIYLEKQNKPDLAEKKFLQALKHYPDYYDALFKLGTIYDERKQYAEAEEYLDQAVKVFPQQAEARSLLAQVLWTRGTQMRDELRELLKESDSDSEEVQAFQKAMVEKIQRAIQHRGVLVNLEPTPENFFKLAEAYKEVESWNDAINAYREALRRQPSDLDARFGLMEALIRTQMLDGALKMAERTIEDFPAESEPYIIRGRVYALLGENDKAIEELDAALKWADAAEAIDIKYDLARVRTAMEHYDTAVAIIEQIDKDQPNEDRSRLLLAEIYSKQERWGQALEELNKYLENNPTDLGAETQKGYFMAMKDMEQGIGFLKELGEKNPNAFSVPMALAQVYARKQQAGQALESLNQAVEKGFVNYTLLYGDETFEQVLQEKGFIQLIRKIQENIRQSTIRSLIPEEKPVVEEEPVLPEEM